MNECTSYIISPLEFKTLLLIKKYNTLNVTFNKKIFVKYLYI